MAEILLDPDNLSQGNNAVWNTANPGQGPTGTLVFGTVSGVTCNLTGALEPVAQFGYFEIRNAGSANNNGLYQVDVVNTASADYNITKIAGAIGDLTVDAGDTSAFMLGGDTTTGNTTPGVSINPAATGKSVYFDTFANKVWLLNQGNMTDKGVSLQALYSFTKEEWKNDPYLIQFDFPFTAITPEQFETAQSWRFYDNAIDTTAAYDGVTGRGTRELIRTGGWSEFNENDTTELAQQYAGVITLGTFEDSTNEDFAYIQFGNDPEDVAARDDFVFTGPVNEAIRVYDVAADASTGTDFTFAASTITRTSGSWFTDGFNQGGKVRVIEAAAGNEQAVSVEITELSATVLTVAGTPYSVSATDTTARIAYDNRSAINVFLRGNTAPASTSLSKSYNSSDLPAIGVTTVANQVYRFPLNNSLDAKVSVNDTDIVASAAGTEFDQIRIRYFTGAFSYDVDTVGTPRDFGIVIDAGTHSGIDGSTATSSIFTTTTGGIDDPGVGTYDGGTLTIHEGADAGIYTIVSSTDTTVTVSETFGSISNQSFTLQRATKIFSGSGPTIEQIYNRVQYQLRQADNINDTSGGTVIAGDTADELLSFVGDAITAGNLSNPVTNPEGGGSGVAIVGFDVNDTNDVTQIDNVPTIRNFPFLASGTLNFNNNLDNDTDSKFWMFFDRTNRRSVVNADVAPTAGLAATITCDATGSSLTDFTQEAVDADGPSNAQLQVGDYIRISGFVESVNNGLWRIDTYTSATSITATKSDGDTPVTETNVAGVFVDEDPIDSPDAIIVRRNNGNIISGTISATVGFDFDFTNNNQGSRSPSSNVTLFPAAAVGNPAVVVIRAIGLDGSQFVEVDSSITRSAGQSISVVGGQERNYSNP
tara:strand:- start:2433 stop:5057 length:2625 start_codon:yes stop_codon:yes gene_type:complete